jgi:hypothetical protein
MPSSSSILVLDAFALRLQDFGLALPLDVDDEDVVVDLLDLEPVDLEPKEERLLGRDVDLLPSLLVLLILLVDTCSGSNILRSFVLVTSWRMAGLVIDKAW